MRYIISLIIVAIYLTGCSTEYEPVELDHTVYISNSFSPNNDGINDTWRPTLIVHRDAVIAGQTPQPHLTYQTYLRVMDFDGAIMFESSNESDSWNGTYKGTTVPLGPYRYYFRFEDSAGGTAIYTGSLTVLP